MNADKFQSAVRILKTKAEQLDRMPKKSDLTEKELCFVKGVLGPFPRALEQAGLKEPRKTKGGKRR